MALAAEGVRQQSGGEQACETEDSPESVQAVSITANLAA
jgi:hypothetical protein